MELFDFGIPALDKALNLTATVLLLLALGMLLILSLIHISPAWYTSYNQTFQYPS